MTPEQTEKLRAQFEAWALTQGMVIERYPPHHPTWPGQYMWTTPHRDWTVWQACACLVEQDTWERAAVIAGEHECGGPDDITCQHQNCAMCIEAAIRTAAAKEAES